MPPSLFGHIAWQAFYWPGGALLGNLLANVIWMVVHDWPQHRQTRKEIRKVKPKELS